MATLEQGQEALARKVSGPQSDEGGISLDVLEVAVSSVSPDLVLKVRVGVSGQIWEVSLDYQRYEASLVSGDLTEETLS
ncbi:hypothetical protein [Streptomyces sp. NPDC099088]|uniref:hypothetical protein n=1 Tax=Streptomyces sp. NPDC099088 TaxID=3366101 RepID=UPI0037F1871C